MPAGPYLNSHAFRLTAHPGFVPVSGVTEQVLLAPPHAKHLLRNRNKHTRVHDPRWVKLEFDGPQKPHTNRANFST